MKLRLPALLSALVLAGLLPIAHAYINPSAVGVADKLANEAAALHTYIHYQYPGALSGATVHEYDNAADDLDDELALWSIGLAPESSIYPLLDDLDDTWRRYALTAKLEKLFAGDPTGRKIHKKCKKLHMTLSLMIEGMGGLSTPPSSFP